MKLSIKTRKKALKEYIQILKKEKESATSGLEEYNLQRAINKKEQQLKELGNENKNQI